MHQSSYPSGSPAPSLTELIEHSTWGRGLSAIELNRVLDTTIARSVPANTQAVQAGDASQHWIGVIDGLLKMSVGRPDGRVSTLTGVARGGWFGEGSLLKREAFRYDVVALRDSHIALLPRATFEWLRSHSLAFNHYLQHLLNARLGLFIGLLENDRLLGAEARVARCLASLYNPDLYPEPGPYLDLLQGEVALLAGISRQTANRALGHLADLELISLESRGITVLDVDRLRSFEAAA
jgi:CRP-like cAMP-binding protein